MSRICFISLDNINRVPYLSRYAQFFDGDYDIIYWNRSGIDERVRANGVYAYRNKLENNTLGFSFEKLLGYLAFRRFAAHQLKKKKYDLVVALTTNVGVLLGSVLQKEYQGRYIVDVRDYWHDFNRLYRHQEKKLLENALQVVVSSPAYRRFIPCDSYIVMHNISHLDSETKAAFRTRKLRDKEPIRVVCVGAAKNLDNDRRVIQHFANDSRFTLSFIGQGYDELGRFCHDISASNIRVEGYFQPNETLDKYQDADMVLSMYGNHTPYYDYALSNKLYFAAQLGLPIIVSSDTYMAEMVTKYYFGIAFDVDASDSCNQVYEYYCGLDREKLNLSCDSFLGMCAEDEEKTKQRISEIEKMLNGGSNNEN